MEKTRETRRVPDQVLEAVNTVVAYLWDSERDDFLGQPEEEPEGHVFQSLLEISNWLSRMNEERVVDA